MVSYDSGNAFTMTSDECSKHLTVATQGNAGPKAQCIFLLDGGLVGVLCSGVWSELLGRLAPLGHCGIGGAGLWVVC